MAGDRAARAGERAWRRREEKASASASPRVAAAADAAGDDCDAGAVVDVDVVAAAAAASVVPGAAPLAVCIAASAVAVATAMLVSLPWSILRPGTGGGGVGTSRQRAAAISGGSSGRSPVPMSVVVESTRRCTVDVAAAAAIAAQKRCSGEGGWGVAERERLPSVFKHPLSRMLFTPRPSRLPAPRRLLCTLGAPWVLLAARGRSVVGAGGCGGCAAAESRASLEPPAESFRAPPAVLDPLVVSTPVEHPAVSLPAPPAGLDPHAVSTPLEHPAVLPAPPAALDPHAVSTPLEPPAVTLAALKPTTATLRPTPPPTPTPTPPPAPTPPSTTAAADNEASPFTVVRGTVASSHARLCRTGVAGASPQPPTAAAATPATPTPPVAGWSNGQEHDPSAARPVSRGGVVEEPAAPRWIRVCCTAGYAWVAVQSGEGDICIPLINILSAR